MQEENRLPDEARAERKETPEPAAPRGGTGDFAHTSSNVDPRLAAFLSYFLSIFISFLGGLIFYLVEKENRFIRFHALQAIFFNVAVIVVSVALTILTAILAFVPLAGWVAGAVLWGVFGVGALVYWIVLMVKSIQGEYYKIPLIGDWADQYV